MKTMMNENGRFACWMLRPLFAVAMLMVALPSWSATIDSVEFSSLPGDKTEIRLHFDGPPPEPTGYTIEQPARIVLVLRKAGGDAGWNSKARQFLITASPLFLAGSLLTVLG